MGEASPWYGRKPRSLLGCFVLALPSVRGRGGSTQPKIQSDLFQPFMLNTHSFASSQPTDWIGRKVAIWVGPTFISWHFHDYTIT